LDAGWREEDLSDFAQQHFRKAFFAMKPRDLMAIINSALYRDFFARRFLKELKLQLSARSAATTNEQ